MVEDDEAVVRRERRGGVPAKEAETETSSCLAGGLLPGRMGDASMAKPFGSRPVEPIKLSGVCGAALRREERRRVDI